PACALWARPADAGQARRQDVRPQSRHQRSRAGEGVGRSWCPARWRRHSVLIPPLPAKENPRSLTAGGTKARAAGKLAADIAGDDVAKHLPPLALEPHQLELADRGEIGR